MLQQPMLEPASGRVSPRSHGGWSALAQLGIISSIIVSNIGLSMMISHYSRNLRLQLDSALTHQAVSGIVPGVALSLFLSLSLCSGSQMRFVCQGEDPEVVRTGSLAHLALAEQLSEFLADASH